MTANGICSMSGGSKSTTPRLRTKWKNSPSTGQRIRFWSRKSGTAIGLLQELAYRVPGITGIKPDKDKITRMSLATPIFRAGQVHFPESAAWLPELEAELFAFPGGRHDDQVNSISQAINNGSNSDLQVWRKLAGADFTQLSQRPYHQSYPGHVF